MISSSKMARGLMVVTVAINALGIGIVLPVMPELLKQVGNADIGRAAAIGGYLSLAFAGMQVLCGPLLGALSDRFGRRPVMVLSLIASALDYAVLATASVLWLFLAARLMSGAASATFSVANAALADLAPPQERASQFGLTGAAFGVGFVLGPVVGGTLGQFGPRAPFVAAAVLCAAAATLCALFLPETLSRANVRPMRLADCVPLAAFAKLRHRRALLPLLVANFLDGLSGLVYPAVWSFFAVARFGWNPAKLGMSLAAYGLSMAVIQAGAVRLLVSRLGERRTSILGLGAGVLGFLVLSILESGTLALLLTPLFASRAVSNTAISGLLSRSVPDDEQGELQGILAAVTGVATLIAIPLLTQVFAVANRPGLALPWPGAPFAVAAGFSLLALATLLFEQRDTPLPT